VELQYAGLQGRLRRRNHVHILLLLTSPPVLFVREHPQVVALCSPALERGRIASVTILTGNKNTDDKQTAFFH